MTRYLAPFVVALVSFAACVSTATAVDDTVSVSPQQSQVDTTEAFTIFIEIGSDLQAVKSFHFLVRLDTTVLRLDSVLASQDWLDTYPVTSSPWPITAEVVDSLTDDTSLVVEIFNVFLDPALLYMDGPGTLAELYLSGIAAGRSEVTFEYSLIADTSAPYPVKIAHSVRDGLVIVGEACVPPGDITADGDLDISDLTWLVNYLFMSGPDPLGEPGAANYNCDPDGVIDISDLTRLVNRLFVTFEPLCNPCLK